jgi:hypothetical protein
VSTTTAVAIPSPTQPNSIAANCDKFEQAQSGDYCDEFAAANGITDTELYEWNAILGVNGADCSAEMWAGYWYCVGVSP